MFKKLLIALSLLVFFSLPSSVSAFKPDTYVTISNPVRGFESWTDPKQHPLDLPKFQYQESTHSAMPVTWLLRYDAVLDATISGFFKNLSVKDENQFLGAFLEVTPWLAKDAGVIYPEGYSIFNSHRVFLSGYTQSDRLLLIDTFMSTFFEKFGYYPKSVSAWHLDSYSLEYLQSKYSVLTAMNCDEQYAMDGYRLWGGYIGSPYFPDKNNSLIPASNRKNRVNLAMVRWAQRDFGNFYGDGSASLYSVQVNDYTAVGQTTKYFDKLLSLYGPNDFNEFTYVNIGLENGYSLSLYKQEIKNVYKSLKTNEGKLNINLISLADFGTWMLARYPESSPVNFYRTPDIAEANDEETYWYQSPFYRIGLKSENGQTKIIDFRVYNREVYENHYATPNQDSKLYEEIPAIIDTVKKPGTEIILDIDLQSFKTVYDKQWDLWQISLQNGDTKITFYPEYVTFTNISVPEINLDDLKISTKNSETTWKASPHTPLKDYKKYSWVFWVALLLMVVKTINTLIKKGKPKPPASLLLGILFILIISITVFRSGQIFPFGLGFFGPNGHDAIFHLSLIEKFSQSPLDFSHPQYAGAKLTNYHFVFDYLAGILSLITKIPPTTLNFVILPLILGAAIVFLLEKLLTKWHYSKLEKGLSFFFVFLSGSFGFIPKIISGQNLLSGESAFWANQSASLFLNPPFALSLVFLIMFLLSISSKERPHKSHFIKTVLIGAVLSQTKIYAFILLCISLLLTRQFSLMFGVGLLGTAFSLPFSSFTGSPFIFEPLWFTKSLFASGDRFYWPKLVSAWQSYEATGNFPKLFAINIFATTSFIIGNLGMRVLGVWRMATSKITDVSEKTAFWIVISGIIIPLLIIQKINPWNTIQFTYYSLFFLGIFTAKAISEILKSINSFVLKLLIVLAVLVISSLTTIGTLKDYLGYFSSSRISFTEMRALETLKNKPKGIVLSPLFEKGTRVATPKPLYAYVSTAYISALSGQPEFISDTINLDITGFDYKVRSREVQRFYSTKDKVWAKSFIEKNNIKYIYETPLQKMSVSPGDLSLEKIFDSGEITIYQSN